VAVAARSAFPASRSQPTAEPFDQQSEERSELPEPETLLRKLAAEEPERSLPALESSLPPADEIRQAVAQL
jgi:hypothetical protein